MPARPSTWRYTREELESAVAHSTSFREVLRTLGLSMQGGGAYSTLHRRIAMMDLDTSHFTGQRWNRGNRHPPGRHARPLEQVLVRNSPVTSIQRLKRRLIALGMLENRCQICGL